MNTGMPQAPTQWPKPGSLVLPYLWSLALPIAWALGILGVTILAFAVRLSTAGDYDSDQDAGLAIALLVQSIGGLAAWVTFVILAWVKGQQDATARPRFLGYGTIALAAVTIVAVILLFLLPDGSSAAA
ncbi:hypothetical protein [Flindersiella endophytica]